MCVPRAPSQSQRASPTRTARPWRLPAPRARPAAPAPSRRRPACATPATPPRASARPFSVAVRTLTARTAIHGRDLKPSLTLVRHRAAGLEHSSVPCRYHQRERRHVLHAYASWVRRCVLPAIEPLTLLDAWHAPCRTTECAAGSYNTQSGQSTCTRTNGPCSPQAPRASGGHSLHARAARVFSARTACNPGSYGITPGATSLASCLCTSRTRAHAVFA